MRRILHQILVTLLLHAAAIAQNKILWNGELANAGSCNVAYGSILSGADAHSGDSYFRAEPDNSHSPRIAFNCTGNWRADISRFDQIRFFIKSNQPSQNTNVRFTTFFGKGKWVQLGNYLADNTTIGTTYQEVVIPLDSLKTQDYDLSSIEYLEFGTSMHQVQFYIDDIILTDTTPPSILLEPVSTRVLKLKINEMPDTLSCYSVSNYNVTSISDTDYQTETSPVKIGRHAFVSGLRPFSGSAIVQHELFLVFEKPLKNGTSYHLQIETLKDPAGNTAFLDTTFTFSYQQINGNVKASQVGYLPDSPKLAKLGNFLGDAGTLPIDTINPPDFQILNELGNYVFQAKSKFLKIDSLLSGEMVFDLDFSAFKSPGKYHLYVPGYGKSKEFEIKTNVFDQTYYHTARALFYQRSTALSALHAGQWDRSGLPDPTAEIHASHTSSPLFNATDYAPGSKIPMSGGWLDAGDYGRYVPTAASALFILFTAFELYPEKFPDAHLNIPESGNAIPDILDEVKYETTWLKQMQAPDGGVYFRVTPASWSVGLPEQETNTLYVSEKTTQATALFAASMAMASRSFKKYFPAHADSCLAMAVKAWEFLAAHPQASAPVSTPGISARPYPDPEDRDNRAWAAAELYKSTGNAIYNAAFLNYYAQIPHEFHATMSWQQHTLKAAWAYSTTKFTVESAVVNEFKSKLLSEVLPNYHHRTFILNAYHGAYHPFKGYIGYGTFGMAQSYAFDYIMFSFLMEDPALLEYAKVQLDIPLGNNPLSKSFITGIGSNSPQFPLHWSTATTQYQQPVPGVPVFGPAASLVMNRPSSFVIQDSLNRYPYGFKKEDPHPVLRRYTDAREAVEMSEFTVQEMAVTAAAFAFFSSVVNVALPVKLSAFDAKAENCMVRLTWTTSQELDAAYFVIERSGDGRNFSQIGTMKAAGQSSQFIDYEFIDQQPGHQNYYRLRQVDFDQKTEVSSIRFAAGKCKPAFTLTYEDQHLFRLNIKAVDENRHCCMTGSIYNVAGTRMFSFKVNSNNATYFDCATLVSGIYILKVYDGQQEVLFTEKLIIY
jgi:hypothetical protein